MNDNANFAFRIVTEFESTAIGSGSAAYIGASNTYGTGGNLRYDMVTVYGTPIVTSGPPALAPVLGMPQRVGNEIVFQLTGTTSSNYVVQTGTNLSSWVNVHTNAAPFWFTNPIIAPQQFYRGAVAP